MNKQFIFLFVARALLIVVALSGLFFGEWVSSVLLLIIFLVSHWLVDAMVEKKRLRKQWHNKNFFLSAVGILLIFGFLVLQEKIPMLLAAIFIASLVIKTVFMSEGFQKNHDVVYKPFWLFNLLVADMAFLMCYIVPRNDNVLFVSGLFLAYGVLLANLYTMSVKSLYVKKRRPRRLASR